MSVTFSTSKNIFCNGGNDGKLIVTPYFGVGPYNYSWSPNVTSFIDSAASNLSAGNYSVTITDSRDSIAFTNITLTQPTAITISSIITDVKCFQGDSGKINVTATGGTVSGNYGYNWQTNTGSGVVATAEDQNNLTAAEYYLTVTDDNACQVKDTFQVGQPTAIIFNGSIVNDITNPPGGNGAVNLNATGGTTPYQTYSWTGPTGYTAATEDISSLITGGTYNITVSDNNSCNYDTSFLVNDITLLIAHISDKKDISCKGGSDGSATVSVENGSGNYTYYWTDGTNQIGGNFPTISNRTEGTYYVTVTDNNDARTAETSVILYEPLKDLTTFINGTDLKCYNDTSGIADLSVFGGTLPYSYSWIGPNGFTANTEDLVNVIKGSYSVAVTDANGCISNNSVSLIEPNAIQIDLSITKQLLCYGDLNGEITASVSGGNTGNKTYLWDDPASQTNPIADGLEAGNYTLTITDIKGCKASSSISLTQPSEILITETHADPSCFGSADGQIIPVVVANTGTSPYDYVWSTGGTNRIITGIGDGDYTLTVTDFNNCTNELNVTLTEPPQITYQSVNHTDASCFGYSDGTISVMAGGGAGTYEYSSDNGTTFQSSGDFTNLPATDYTLLLRDANSCLSKDSVVSLSEPPEIIYQSINITDASCYGSTDGAISITADGTVGPYNYSNDNGATFQTSGDFTGLPATDYTLLLRDANSCLSKDSVVSLSEPSAINILSETATNITCPGFTNGSITISASDGAGGYTYSIDDGNMFFDNGGIFDSLAAGDYPVKVKDADNCEVSGSTLTINEPDIFIVDTFSVTSAAADQNGSAVLEATGGTQPFTFIIKPPDADSLTSSSGQFSDLPAGNYLAYAIDNNGCNSNSLALDIISLAPKSVILYNAFSPNGDNVNDVWNIGNIQDYPNCTVRVFNAWGNEVFSSHGYAKPWDGKYNGKYLPSGTYYYIINLGDGSETMTGPLNIVK